MPAPKPVEILFTKDRDTKNKTRFQEVFPRESGDKEGQPVPTDQEVVGKLYISKKALKKLGDSELLIVTIAAP